MGPSLPDTFFNSPLFSHASVPPSVFAKLLFNSIMAIRSNSSKSHCPKAFLRVSGICHSGRWLMALAPYGSAVLWAYRRLHDVEGVKDATEYWDFEVMYTQEVERENYQPVMKGSFGGRGSRLEQGMEQGDMAVLSS